ncbi:MAG: SGNH/GDSL hydrolase family protein [Clostridia bacterium]|nr:SGNH/GDSL hydrolase family protein [Clostridia bacterium]
MKKRIWSILAACLAVGVCLGVLQALVMPKYTDHPEGALVGEYYDQAGNHDVIFVGDCEVYESFVPAVLWEEYGIRSYVRGSPQQLTWQSYYILKETFRYEKPKAVVFNVLALKYGEPQDEAMNRLTLDGMRWSWDKVGAILSSMTEDESFLDYLFPFLRYHSRITELTEDDVRYLVSDPPAVSDSGYLMQTGVLPPTEEAKAGKTLTLSESILPETSMEYLEKMRLLCEANGCELILVKSPTQSSRFWWYDEWEERVTAYAAEKELSYYNMIPMCEEIGIDWNTDTYDYGAHMNVNGAEKTTRFFGKLLQQCHGLADHRTEEASVAIWSERVEQYQKRKEQAT